MNGLNFRVWDKANKKWFNEELLIVSNGFLYEDHRGFEDSIELQENEYELVRFTGLTDKQGTQILEGDILQWDEKEWGGPFNELVEWDYEQFSSRENDWKRHCLIIGNKFDNPELLGGEK